MRKEKVALAVILLLGLLVRFWKINTPLLEFYPTRQVQTADISRNLYLGRSDFLHPSVSYLGPGQTTYALELPLYNLVVSTLYKIHGGIWELSGRLFSIAGWFICSIFLYLITKKYFGIFAAVSAVYFYAFFPLSVLVSRSFQPDQWMLTASVASIYFADKWTGKRNFILLASSAILAALALLLKIQAVFFTLIPVTFILVSHSRKFKSRKLISILLFLFVILLPSAIWYYWASKINVTASGLVGSFKIVNWFGFDVFLNPKYYSNVFGFEYDVVLLPIGLTLFALGVLLKLSIKQRLFYWWLIGVALYFLVFNKHSMTHEYYHLPIVPIASVFAGYATQVIYEALKRRAIVKTILLPFLATLIFVIMLVPTAARAYSPIDRFKHIVEAGNAIQSVTKPNDLVITLMDSGPTLAYYSNRAGWEFEINNKRIEENRALFKISDNRFTDPVSDLESLRSRGAVIFAIGNKDQLLQYKDFKNYMYDNYSTLYDNNNFVIFDLKNKIHE